jgi:hypothetical protein
MNPKSEGNNFAGYPLFHFTEIKMKSADFRIFRPETAL